MSKHRLNARRVARTQPAAGLGGQQKSLPHYYRGERSHEDAQHFISLDAALAKKERGLGEFINRGRAFRSFDIAIAAAEDITNPSGRRGQSLSIAEPPPRRRIEVELGAMTRYVADREQNKRGTAILRAVEGWSGGRVEHPDYPYIFRWDRHGRKGKFCRIAVRGRKMNSLLLEFPDGFRMGTSGNAVVRRPEFRYSGKPAKDSAAVRREASEISKGDRKVPEPTVEPAPERLVTHSAAGISSDAAIASGAGPQ